jgi:hypothetical protein
VREFAGVVDPETVRLIFREEAEALRQAPVREFQPIFAERAARVRLASLAQTEHRSRSS